jgi:hypothetical protein
MPADFVVRDGGTCFGSTWLPLIVLLPEKTVLLTPARTSGKQKSCPSQQLKALIVSTETGQLVGDSRCEASTSRCISRCGRRPGITTVSSTGSFADQRSPEARSTGSLGAQQFAQEECPFLLRARRSSDRFSPLDPTQGGAPSDLFTEDVRLLAIFHGVRPHKETTG